MIFRLLRHLFPAASRPLRSRTSWHLAVFAGSRFFRDLSSRFPLCLPLSLLLLGTAAAARAGPVSVQTLTTREGLAGDVVTSLAFEPNGSAWVGTTAGATHIEGSRWTSYTQEHGLGASWINAIAVAPDGRTWFATNGGGLSVFDGRKFITHVLTGTQSLPSNFVTAVAVEPQGGVWVGTLDSGVARLPPGSSRWIRYSLPNNYITALVLDAQGAPWVGTDGGGVFRFDGKSWHAMGMREGVVGQIAPASDAQIKTLRIQSQQVQVRTADGSFAYDGTTWRSAADPALGAAANLGLRPSELRTFAEDPSGRLWGGTAQGLRVSSPLPATNLRPTPLPVLLVHGWTGPESDRLPDSEFRFLQQYTTHDGISVYFAEGISPKHTLYQNAENLRANVARVRQATGVPQVDILAFSMGGLNTRAFLETTLYSGDVHRAIILGTPQAGVDVWYPILIQQILQKPDEPSAIELTPEYARLWNVTHAPRLTVPYDLLAGDTRNQIDLPVIRSLPASDGLIGVWSALALEGPNVRRNVNGDLHAFEPTAIPFALTSFLYPNRTYERFLRNALTDSEARPMGSEVQATGALTYSQPGPRNHTPLVTTRLGVGQTLTRTVVLDVNTAARFIAYYPGGRVDLDLTGPDGKRYTGKGMAIGETNGALRLQADIANFVGYSLDRAAPGRWQMTITRTDRGAQPLDVLTYVDLDAPLRLALSTDKGSGVPPESLYHAGDTVTLLAALSNPSAARGLSVRATVTGPDRSESSLVLYDDGAHSDGKAGDGVFANTLSLPGGGYYIFRSQVQGAGFERESELVLPVADDSANLVGTDVTRTPEGLMAQVRVNVRQAGAYAVSVTLRGPAAAGADGPVVARLSSPSLALDPGEATVPVLIPAADLRLRAVSGPYRVDVILMDAGGAGFALEARTGAAIAPSFDVNQ